MSCHSTVSNMSNFRTFVVRRLDGVDQDVALDKKANGLDLLDKVCKTLGLMEREYFGLQYADKNGDHLWINLRNPLQEQLPQGSIRPTVEMKVKYFVSPQKLMQPITRVQFYKHIRKDLVLGRLRSASAKAARLTALIAQIDKGDYHLNFKYNHKVPCSSSDMDNYDARIRREHHKISGTPGEVAIESFLNEASGLEHYGVEMHEVVNGNRTKLTVGVGPEYILIMSPQMEVFDRYHYDAIQYTAFHARKFTAMMQSEEDDRPAQLEYELKSRAAAQALYRSVTEFHTFFQQDKVSTVVKSAGYCKSLIGSFKGQSPDRFYFDVTRTHQEVVDHLWPILHPNCSQSTRPLPPISSPSTYHNSSSMSLASQRSTRSLPSNSPHHRAIRVQNSLQRSISSDNNFRRAPHIPPPFLPPGTPTSHNSSRRGPDVSRVPPPRSPFFPYASTIDGNSDSEDQNTYVSGESDTYVCMRSLRGSDTYAGAGSDTYVNSGASEVSSTSLENRIPSPPPVYSEVDPNSDVPSPPPRPFAMNGGDHFTISGVLNPHQVTGTRDGVFTFDTQERVLARTRELESELTRLKSAMTCRMCRNNSIGATFCPCGHTVCCLSCAQKLKQCWECDRIIDTVQKIVLA